MDSLKFNTLLRRIDNEDKPALDEIYNEYCNKIRFTARYYCGDWSYSYDILNEVLIKIWNNSKKYINIQTPNAWIYKLSKNTAITFYNKHIKRHKKQKGIDEIVTNQSSSDDVYNFEFDDLIQSLDKTAQEIVIMKVLYKFTFKEIAKAVKMPQGTVSWKYNEALNKLKIEIIEINS